MGKTKKRFLSKLRPGKERQHWLGHGVDGQETLLIDLDPYLYVLDSYICKVSQQIAFSEDLRISKLSKERPKAAIILGEELNPWSIGYLSDRFDVVLVTDFIDPIIEETANRFNAIILDEEKFFELEPVFDFVLFFNCSAEIDGKLAKSAFDISHVLSTSGVALFPIINSENSSPETRVAWIASSLGFREFSEIEIYQTNFTELKKLPDFGVLEFSKRHKNFYGKEARDLCLKRLYEDDFQEAVNNDKRTIELIVATK